MKKLLFVFFIVSLSFTFAQEKHEKASRLKIDFSKFPEYLQNQPVEVTINIFETSGRAVVHVVYQKGNLDIFIFSPKKSQDASTILQYDVYGRLKDVKVISEDDLKTNPLPILFLIKDGFNQDPELKAFILRVLGSTDIIPEKAPPKLQKLERHKENPKKKLLKKLQNKFKGKSELPKEFEKSDIKEDKKKELEDIKKELKEIKDEVKALQGELPEEFEDKKD